MEIYTWRADVVLVIYTWGGYSWIYTHGGEIHTWCGRHTPEDMHAEGGYTPGIHTWAGYTFGDIHMRADIHMGFTPAGYTPGDIHHGVEICTWDTHVGSGYTPGDRSAADIHLETCT